MQRIHRTLVVILPLLVCSAWGLSATKVLVVGATGKTGKQALSGLVNAGYQKNQLRVVSRDASKLKDMQKYGYDTCQADLDDVESLISSLGGCNGCYVHAVGSYTKDIDTKEITRARNLAFAISLSVDEAIHVVYNGAMGEDLLIGIRKRQKRDVEHIFKNEFPTISFTSLRANFFMDLLWKDYNRPTILKGKFRFCVPRKKDVYLTSVKDLGFIAGRCLQSTETTTNRCINVASDVLAPEQMAQAFSKYQDSKCKHSRGRVMSIVARLLFKSIWEDFRYLRKSTEVCDIEGLKREFGSVTSFEEFLEESGWSNEELSFEDFAQS